MAIVDLTNFDPYAGELESQRRAHESRARLWSGVAQGVSDNIQRGVERRQAMNAQSQQIRDREYALVNKATDQLVQPKTNSKITDVKLQELGQQFKSEYYDAVKAYEESDKGDDARREFETVKQRSLTSAKTVSGSIEALQGQAEVFRGLISSGGISDAVNPAIRSFMADLIDPETPDDQYQIQPDPDTGELRYVGKTKDGDDVDFLLDDIANGENQFNFTPKTNMTDVITNVLSGVSDLTKTEERAWGVAEVTDWGSIGTAIDGRLDKLINEEGNLRSIAAELGYGYEDFQSIKEGGSATGRDGEEVVGIEGLKVVIKEELMDQIESTTPHKENALQGDPNAQKRQMLEQKAFQGAQTLTAAAQSGDTAAYNEFLNKKVTLGGVAGQVASIKPSSGGKVEVIVRSGQKGGAKQTFDTNKPEEAALMQSILTGVDYSVALHGINKFNQSQAKDLESRLLIQ